MKLLIMAALQIFILNSAFAEMTGVYVGKGDAEYAGRHGTCEVSFEILETDNSFVIGGKESYFICTKTGFSFYFPAEKYKKRDPHNYDYVLLNSLNQIAGSFFPNTISIAERCDKNTPMGEGLCGANFNLRPNGDLTIMLGKFSTGFPKNLIATLRRKK